MTTYEMFKIESDKREGSAIGFAVASLVFVLMWRFGVCQYIRTDAETQEFISDIFLLVGLASIAGMIKTFVEAVYLQVRAWRAKSKEAK